MAKKNSGYAVGIDLGTTYSCVGVWREDRQHVEIITNEQGNRITPSCVAFKNGRWLIGEAAANEAKRNPANTVYDVKRLIGRKYNDPAIQDDMKKWPFTVIADEKDNPMIVVTDNQGEKTICSPEDISAMILKKMCKYAETYLQAPVKDVVITVPAYFNDSQRQATKKAGASAGLNVVRIINEPSAAALAYGQEKRAKYVDRVRNVFIFDLGGGTFDVSIVNANYKNGTYQVKAKAGNNHLGGEDFVNKMMTYFMEEFKRKNRGVEISGDAQALRNLRTECENAKKQLSDGKEAFIDIYCNDKELHSRITRGRFEELNKKYFEECMEIVKSCFKDAKSSVDDVVLIGGSSRIPKLQELMQDFFKDKELDKSINVDEAVAYGAAVQAAMLSGSIGTGPVVALYDVTPLSLGISVRGDIISVLIPRNTPYPTKVEQKYFTAQDNQTSVAINVYEGQRKIASANNLLGSIHLTGIPPALRGHPITVCFQVDADGILRVSVEEKMAGKMEKKINKSRLSNRDITKLIEEGKMNEAEDDKHVENREAIKTLDRYVYKMEAILKDKKKMAKLSSQDKENISSAIAKAKKLLGDRKGKEKTTVVKDRIEKVKCIYDSITAKTG